MIRKLPRLGKTSSVKKILEKIYQEWYDLICEEWGFFTGAVLELGSGAGFLDEFIPNHKMIRLSC